MPAVSLSPIFNGYQAFSSSGLPLAFGTIDAFIAGSSTPLATYTTAAGNIANSNPITLLSDGRPPQEIWLLQSSAYRFVLKDALGNQIGTYDDIAGIEASGGSGSLRTQLADPTSVSNGAAIIGRGCQFVNSIAQLRALLKTSPSLFAYCSGYYAAGDHGGGQFYYDSTDTTSTDNGGTIIVASDGGRWKRVFTGDLYDKWFGAKVDGVTDETAAIVAMLVSITNPLQQKAQLTSGSHLITGATSISIPDGVALVGPGKGRCTVLVTSTTASPFLMGSYTKLSGFEVRYPNQVVSGTPTVYPPTIGCAGAGCSYVEIEGIRFYNSYDGIVMGDSTHGISNITVNDVDGFPLHIGMKFDNCVDTVRVGSPTFNRNLVGNIYDGDNSITKWVFQNGIAMRFLRVDGIQVDRPLVHGYKRPMTCEAGFPSGSANFCTVVNPIFDLCQAPFETVNYQDGVTIIGGTLTSSQGYFSLTGVPMPLAGGSAINQCVKFVGTIFRNFYDGIAACTTNVDFIDCEFYNYNAHDVTPVGAVYLGANNITVRVTGGRIDGGSHTNSRGIDNQNNFTGTTMVVHDVTFTNLGSNSVFQPSKTLQLGLCPGFNTTGGFYNGLVINQNANGQMTVGAIPAAGTWGTDDEFQRTPQAVGQPKSWKCSAAGTSGTWTSTGNL
jgi:hypothetical protein